MPSDALAELTRLQEQEERAVEVMEEHQRQLATLQALLEDRKQRGEAAGGIEAQMQAAEGEVLRAEREIAALREKIVAAEQALPANLKDEDEA
jgi:predicted  nucleic acid-binding Zn-ribbon protein